MHKISQTSTYIRLNGPVGGLFSPKVARFQTIQGSVRKEIFVYPLKPVIEEVQIEEI
jgi:hypothetical protein